MSPPSTFYSSINQEILQKFLIDYKLRGHVLWGYSMSNLCKSMRILDKISNLLIYLIASRITIQYSAMQISYIYAYFSVTNN